MENFKRFYNILTKPIYSSYKEAWMLVKHQPYLVQIPITTEESYKNLRQRANAKILYYLNRQNPSPTRGRPRKYQYKTQSEANHFWYEA